MKINWIRLLKAVGVTLTVIAIISAIVLMVDALWDKFKWILISLSILSVVFLAYKGLEK